MTKTIEPEPVSADEAFAIARDAYIYLYPLVLMDVTRRQFLNADPDSLPGAGPANAFRHVRAFPTAEMRAVVRPNFDTLYSIAWLDLTEGPVVMSTEDSGGRYFMLQILDMWTNAFAVPGTRTSGNGAASFAIVPPGWVGDLPSDLHRIDTPTPYSWIIGRTQTNGVDDYAAVHAFQDGLAITLLADRGKTPREIERQLDSSVDTTTEPLRQVSGMRAADFFRYGTDLMQLHPPQATDWSILCRMRRIGLAPGGFDAAKTSPGLLAEAAAAGAALIQSGQYSLGRKVNGWTVNTETMGVYGNSYLKRAVVALVGLGANQPEDAIYPDNFADADGNPVTADKRYVLHFEGNELPPADAFWSLTMYDGEGYQVANSLDRFALGDRDNLSYNADGSLDLFIQHENPGPDREANWLPAPADGKMGMTMRLYAPREEALDGHWTPPPLRQAR